MSAITALNGYISIDPDVFSGQPVFTGTRVPISTLWDHLDEADPLNEFLTGFPGVSREAALAVLAATRPAEFQQLQIKH